MENPNAEQVISELDFQTKLAKFTNSKGVLISVKCAQFVLDHVQYYEQRIRELTEQLDAMRGVAEAWKEHSKTLEGENKKLRALVDEGFDTENSLKGKIKELTEVVKQSETAGGCEESVNNGFSPSVTELQRENERLKAQRYYIDSDGRIEMIPTVESVRADTVREILAKVKERAYYDTTETGIAHMVIDTDDIDEIAKELIGE